MKPVSIRTALLLTLVATAPTFADGGGSAPSMPPPAPTPSVQQPMVPEEQAAMAKANAQRTYADAYKDVEKAQKELDEAAALRTGLAAADVKNKKKADEKEASATKRLKKTVTKFEEVVAADPTNANAWNMLGYSRRMTGNLDGAFDAYWKCLELDPKHAGAHEYLGEAYLKAGKLREARGELAFLEKQRAPEAEKLRVSIETWVAANPEAAKASANASVTPPSPDTK